MKRLLSLLLLTACLLCLCACGQEDRVFATVNGEEIVKDEIDYFSNRLRADVLSDYVQKYDVSDFSDFWDTEFDGTTPSEALEKKAFDEAVRAKIVLMLMRENGIYSDISFDALKKKAEDFNNANAVSAKPIVGIKTVELEQFYTYYISNGEMELKNILAESTLKPSDSELAQRRASADDDISDEMLKAIIVSEKYESYISELIDKAEIVKTVG